MRDRNPDLQRRLLKQAFLGVAVLFGIGVAGNAFSLILAGLAPALGLIALMLVIYMAVSGKWWWRR
jgi:cation transporter-like permease